MHQDNPYKLSVIGLGTMGRNLLLNLAAHGFQVAGYDTDAVKLNLLQAESNGLPVKGFPSLEEMIEQLESPRIIMLLVPAGTLIDALLQDLLVLLQPGDIIIDAGNSHFADTTRRSSYMQSKGLHFFGMGISGGASGARKGPSLMPGGDMQAWKHVQPIMEAIAAKADGVPCVWYMGPGAAGHFVKMAHNGIEYALMQLIADTYEVLRKYLQLDNTAAEKIFAAWNEGPLRSYLLEITASILHYKENGIFLIDNIKDEAKSKGTGKWTSQAAMELQVPVPSIDLAVAMRDLSRYKLLRISAASVYGENTPAATIHDLPGFLRQLEQAFHFSMVVIYAQGMHLLSVASDIYKYNLQLHRVAAVWKGGCIIRAAFLENIRIAFERQQGLTHLLLDNDVQTIIQETSPSARNLLTDLIRAGISAPMYASTLSYFDAFCNGNMPSNLIQAQRDYFGAHTYERNDKEGVFHTLWT